MEHRRRRKRRPIFTWLLVLTGLAAIVFGYLAAFRAGPPPSVTLESGMPGIGKRTPVTIAVAEPTRGLTGFRVEFVQGDRVEVLEERVYEPLEPWQFWGERVTREDLTVDVGSETIKGLREGDASVRVVALRASSLLRYPQPVTQELPLPVKLRPPLLQVASTRTYVAQGGSEAVVYRVGPTSVRDGVQAGDRWFPGFPLAGGDEQDRFALFGVPYEMGDSEQIRLMAYDDVGNQASAAFVDRFFPKPLRRGTIQLSDRFMERVVPPILSQTPHLERRDNVLEDFLMINSELRGMNNRSLDEVGARSAPEFLWTREFMQMRNAQVMSDFAARRRYMYEGREVDVQDHLGFDLASTAMAPIQSANDGVVVLASYFGIYGNTVVVDHGYGLMSLYGHLSSIAVEEGQSVERGQELGRSGATGLAGGDHLHFSMLLQGMPVDPREWWDSHWINDRLKLKLGAALPFGE